MRLVDRSPYSTCYQDYHNSESAIEDSCARKAYVSLMVLPTTLALSIRGKSDISVACVLMAHFISKDSCRFPKTCDVLSLIVNCFWKPITSELNHIGLYHRCFLHSVCVGIGKL